MSGNTGDKLASSPLNSFIEYLRIKKKFLWCMFSILAIYTLAGFFLLPWILQTQLQKTLAENFDSDLQISKTRFNPYTLKLQIDGLALADPAGNRLLQFSSAAINFQLSSAFRRAWTFKTFELDALEIFLQRESSSRFNFSYFTDLDKNANISDESADTGLLPVIVQNIRLDALMLHFSDLVPSTPVNTSVGPMALSISNLSSLLDRSAQQDLVIVFEENSQISMQGQIQLNPLLLSGNAVIQGSYFSLISEYLREPTGIDIPRGQLDVNVNYQLESNQSGELKVSLDELNLQLSDFALRSYAPIEHARAEAGAEFFSLDSVQLLNGGLAWPEQILTIDGVTVNRPYLNIVRDERGVLALTELPFLQSSAEAEAEAEPVHPWDFSLDQFSLNQMALEISDASVASSENKLGLRELNVELNNISSEPGQSITAMLTAEPFSGGTLLSNGMLNILPSPAVDFQVDVNALALEVVQPYLAKFVDLELRSGELNMSGKLVSNDNELLSYQGQADIADLSIFILSSKELLGGWESLAIKNIDFKQTAANLTIAELALSQFYADIEIDSNGQINLSDFAVGSDVEAPSDEENIELDSTIEKPLMEITVGQVTVEDSALDFADFSLPLPFAAEIISLNGSMSTISTISSEASQLAFDGQVDEFGLLTIGGQITPFTPKLNTDIKVNFQNVNVPKFTAYSIPLAGREIVDGRMDLSLDYNLNKSQLDGENVLVLRDFTLGDKVDHPDAMSLPLDLAVALLKGPDGTINLDLPVAGNVDDPEFRYGRVIMQVFSNVIINMVTAPFSFLASLVGLEGDELAFIEFSAGRVELPPPEQEKIAKLAEALLLRPELVLELAGVVDIERDGLVLRTDSLAEQVRQKIEISNSQLNLKEQDEGFLQQRRSALESIHQESATEIYSLEQIQQRNIQQTDEQALVLDELAYLNDLRDVLIVAQVLFPEDLNALARSRANQVRLSILENAPELDERIKLVDIQEVQMESDQMIKMAVSIAVD